MKYNMKLFSLTILMALFMVPGLQAQKVTGYVLEQPGLRLTGGGSICPMPLQNKGKTEDGYSTRYANAFKKALSDENYGNSPRYNNWLTTKLYTLTEDSASADWVLGGWYEFSSGSSQKADDNLIYETGSAEEDKVKIPVHYYSYTASSSATLKGEIYIYGKDGNLLRTMPLEKNASKSETKKMEIPDVPNETAQVNAVANAGINEYAYIFTPRIVAKTYKLERLKHEDRDNKDAIKDKRKEFNDFADKMDLPNMARVCKEALEVEESPRTRYNLAVCYEIIGNYTKAREHYQKSGNTDAITAIDKLISDREKLKECGLTFEEKDF